MRQIRNLESRMQKFNFQNILVERLQNVRQQTFFLGRCGFWGERVDILSGTNADSCYNAVAERLQILTPRRTPTESCNLTRKGHARRRQKGSSGSLLSTRSISARPAFLSRRQRLLRVSSMMRRRLNSRSIASGGSRTRCRWYNYRHVGVLPRILRPPPTPSVRRRGQRVVVLVFVRTESDNTRLSSSACDVQLPKRCLFCRGFSMVEEAVVLYWVLRRRRR